MKNLTLNFDKFKLATIFTYKWNRHIVVWEKANWIFVVDIDYDPEFDFCWDSFVVFISYNSLFEEFKNDIEYLIKEDID